MLLNVAGNAYCMYHAIPWMIASYATFGAYYSLQPEGSDEMAADGEGDEEVVGSSESETDASSD
eukprot:6879624-Pyramimonas_sp.AAC.1